MSPALWPEWMMVPPALEPDQTAIVVLVGLWKRAVAAFPAGRGTMWCALMADD